MKNFKTMIVLCSFLMLGGAFTGTAIAANYQGYPTVGLSVNGNTVQSDVPPIIIDGRTMVPLSIIAQTLGATVSYNQECNYAVITTGSNQASAPTSKASGNYDGLPEVGVLVNGQSLTGSVPPVILNGRTLVPVRMVANALGCTVDYSNGEVTVISSETGGSTVTAPAISGISSSLLSAAQNDTDTQYGNVTGEENAAKNLDSVVNSAANDDDSNTAN